MSLVTGIQWCDSTVNPVHGCGGCELWTANRHSCYAGRIHSRFAGKTGAYPAPFEEVREIPGRMSEAAHWSSLRDKDRQDKPWLDGLPRLIFMSDMADALSEGVLFEFLHREIISSVVTHHGRRHHWLWLTKRPERMVEFSTWFMKQTGQHWPQNLWVGTSVTTQGTLTRVDALARVGDTETMRFLSVEPQIESISLADRIQCLDWVIAGGESGPQSRPFDLEWSRQLTQECRRHGVPFFLKQLGANPIEGARKIHLKDSHGGDWAEWPDDLRVREMPISAETSADLFEILADVPPS